MGLSDTRQTVGIVVRLVRFASTKGSRARPRASPGKIKAPPSDQQATERALVNPASKDDWVEVRDPKKNKKIYYWNRSTSELTTKS